MKVKRLIVTIDENKCTGCGKCVDACPTGALVIVNKKAKLIDERSCDGFGSCIAACPYNALRLEWREVEEFDWSLLNKLTLKDWLEKFRKTSLKLNETVRH